MQKTIIGFDFSLKKPAACIYTNDTYSFYSWPLGQSDKIINIYRNSPVNITYREYTEYTDKDSSKKMRWDLNESMYLSELIVDTISDVVDIKNSYIVFEGLSFSSSGNVVLQLSGYKFILMKTLYDRGVSLDCMSTFAPKSIKSVAQCAKKGMGKKEMIDAFINVETDIPFKTYLFNNKTLFQKKTGTWIDHLDDLIDSYWVIQTFLEKTNIHSF